MRKDLESYVGKISSSNKGNPVKRLYESVKKGIKTGVAIVGMGLLASSCPTPVSPNPPEEKQYELYDNVKVLTSQESNYLENVASNSITFSDGNLPLRFSTGDIIVIDSIENILSLGTTRKITEINTSEDTFITSPASLEDIFLKANFNSEGHPSFAPRTVNYQFINRHYDEDNDFQTTDDEIRTSGNLNLTFTPKLEFEIKNGTLERYLFENEIEGTIVFNIFSGINYPDFDNQITIPSEYINNGSVINTINIPTDPELPLVYQKESIQFLLVKGNLKAGLDMDISNYINSRLGIKYENEMFSNITPTPEYETSFQNNGITDLENFEVSLIPVEFNKFYHNGFFGVSSVTIALEGQKLENQFKLYNQNKTFLGVNIYPLISNREEFFNSPSQEPSSEKNLLGVYEL